MGFRRESRTGQKYRKTSVSVDMDVDIDEFRTLDLIDELLERAECKSPDPEARAWIRPKAVEPDTYELDKERGTVSAQSIDWEDVERALNNRDFDALAAWLWPQVKQRWPRPKLKSLETAEQSA